MSARETRPVRPLRKRTLLTPLVLAALALAAWTGWWFWLVQRIETEIDAQAEAWRGRGWTIEWHDRRVSGWPFRARFEARHLTFASPSGQALALPGLSAEANAYDPTHWVFRTDQGLVLTRGDEKGRVAVGGGPIRASVTGLNRPVPTLALQLMEPTFTAHQGAEPFPLAGADRVEFHLRPHPADAGTSEAEANARRDVFLRLEGARGRPQGPIDRMAAEGRMDLLLQASIDDAVRLRGADVPTALRAWSGAGGRFLDVRGQVRAGEAEAVMTSPQLALDGEGRLAGVVTLDARRVAPALAGLATSDRINPVGAAGAAGAATASAGRTGEVDLRVEFRDGRAYVGPFPLAPAPKLF